MKIVATARYLSHGFSLIELAIVLFIVALLLGGLLPTIGSQIEQKNRSETRKQLDEIQQALMGYAIINKRLPCPAIKNQTMLANPATAGRPDITGSTCNSNPGVLPWVELGLSETDAWGRRFTYAVTSTTAFTSMSGVTLASTGTLTIRDASPGGNILANAIPAVIISHGANGLGAFTPQGTQIPNATASADEQANATAGATTFISHDFNQNFDDQVVWISTNTLFNRMVAAGVLSN